MADRDPLDFTGKVALVTGGGRGVGRGIAEAFLRVGAEVVICGRTEPEALPSADGRGATFLEADVRDPDQVDSLVTATTERFGRVDELLGSPVPSRRNRIPLSRLTTRSGHGCAFDP
jgi:NAD(P)-dependent dehydrogenase (short-subunit alcohol dehydrogenase family)